MKRMIVASSESDLREVVNELSGQRLEDMCFDFIDQYKYNYTEGQMPEVIWELVPYKAESIADELGLDSEGVWNYVNKPKIKKQLEAEIEEYIDKYWN